MGNPFVSLLFVLTVLVLLLLLLLLHVLLLLLLQVQGAAAAAADRLASLQRRGMLELPSAATAAHATRIKKLLHRSASKQKTIKRQSSGISSV